MNRVLTGLRPFDPNDIGRLARLLNQARAWPPAAPAIPEDVVARWERWHVAPEHDINVLPGSDGEFVAYSRATILTEPTPRISAEIAVHPSYRRKGIGSALMDLVLEKARINGVPHVTTPLFVPEGGTSEEGASFLVSQGFFPDRRYWQLRIDGIGNSPPKWPAGFHYRPLEVHERDAARWAELVRTTFGEPSSAPRVLGQLGEPGSHATGFLFAIDNRTGREVGTSRGRLDTLGGVPMGYVGTVGVLPSYRHRGLGRALVLQTLAFLASQGLSSATLFVEATNYGARQLYEQMGWYQVYETVHYWKSINV